MELPLKRELHAQGDLTKRLDLFWEPLSGAPLKPRASQAPQAKQLDQSSPYLYADAVRCHSRFCPPLDFGCKCAAEILPTSEFRMQMCSRNFHRLRISAANVQPKFSPLPNFGCRCAAEIFTASEFRLQMCSRNCPRLRISAADVQPKLSLPQNFGCTCAAEIRARSKFRPHTCSRNFRTEIGNAELVAEIIQISAADVQPKLLVVSCR